MISNFIFMKHTHPWLYELGCLAENNIFHDADTSLYKIRKLGEEIVQMILESLSLPISDSFFINLNQLEEGGFLDQETLNHLHSIRIRGNQTIHNPNRNSVDLAKQSVHEAFQISTYFYKTFVDSKFTPSAFRELNYIQSIDELPRNANNTSEEFKEDKRFFDSFMRFIAEMINKGIIDKKFDGFGSVIELEHMTFHEFYGFFESALEDIAELGDTYVEGLLYLRMICKRQLHTNDPQMINRELAAMLYTTSPWG